MERRCKILRDAAEICARLDFKKLNYYHESGVTYALREQERRFDYSAYVLACLLAAGAQYTHCCNHTNLLYATRDLSHDEQVQILFRAAGIAAHKDFSF